MPRNYSFGARKGLRRRVDGGATPTPSSAPTFSTLPSATVSSAMVGDTVTAADGVVANGAITATSWELNGTVIGTGPTVVPSGSGALVRKNTATGPGGITVARSLPIVIAAVGTPVASAYAETFTYPDNTALYGGTPNWAAISSAGATSNERLNPVVIGNKLMVRASPLSDFVTVGSATNSGRYLLSPVDLGNANMWIEYQVTADTGMPKFCARAVNEVEKIQFNFTATSFNTQRFNGSGSAPANITGTINPVASVGRFAGGNLSTDLAQTKSGDVIRVATYGNKMQIFRNMAPVGPVVDITAGPVGTRFGITTYNLAHQNLDNLYGDVQPGWLTVTETAARYFTPRKFGLGGYPNGAADVTWSGTYEGTAPTAMQWAIYEPETGALIKDWADVTATIGSGVWSMTCRTPWGLNGLKGYRYAFRDKNNPHNFTSIRTEWYVVAMWLGLGQSIINELTYTAGAVSPPHPGGFSYNPPDPSGSGPWASADHTVSTSWRATNNGSSNAFDNNIGIWTKDMAEALGGPVCFANLSIPANGAENMTPGGVWWDYLMQHYAHIGSVHEGRVCGQGEAEVSSGLSYSTHQATWQTTLAAWDAISGQPGGTVIKTIWNITGSYLNKPDPSSQAAANTIRGWQQDVEARIPNNYVGAHFAGLTLRDDVHYVTSALGSPRLTKRLALSSAHAVNPARFPFDGRGPRIANLTISGSKITGTLNKNGAETVTGSNLTSWVVSMSEDMSSPLTINAVNIVDGKLEIDLASPPGGLPWVSAGRGSSPNLSSLAVGTYPGGALTIEMEMPFKPIRVAS